MGTSDTYRIKALEWKEVRPDWFSVGAVFGSMHVECHDDGCWSWRYCFDEYYDEGQHSCESAEAGKKAAEAFYLGRLLPALELS